MSPLMTVLLSSVAAAGFSQAVAGDHAESHGAHVHGEAKLAIAVESPTHGSIDFDVPGDVFGSEAKLKKDKKAQSAAIKKLKALASGLVEFSSSSGCKVSALDAQFESGDGSHADFEAKYEFKCSQPIVGEKAKLRLIKALPQLRKVQVQVIGSSGQSETVHTQDGGEIAF